MIKNETVIVVGAGASKDLGLPLGHELQKNVSELLSFNREDEFELNFRSAITPLFSNDEMRAMHAIHKAEHFASRIKSAASVDNFLDQHKSDTDLVLLTKMAIAYCIADAEKNSDLSAQNFKGFGHDSEYFLLSLLNILVRGHQEHNICDSISNLTFVTFNYDRCLERYFSNWLRFRFGHSAQKYLSPQNFIHVYGSLGDYFDPKAKTPFEYEGRSLFQNVHMELPPCAERLRIFTEQEDSKIASDIRNRIHTAKTLIFLGFGFEEQNMRFFQKSSSPKHVFATLYGMEPPNFEYLKDYLTRLVGNGRPANTLACKSKKLFNDFYHPITQAVGSL